MQKADVNGTIFSYDVSGTGEPVIFIPGALIAKVFRPLLRATFKLDLPGLREWHFNEDEVGRITQPVLNILGGDSEALWARFGEVYRLIQGWVPDARVSSSPAQRTFL